MPNDVIIKLDINYHILFILRVKFDDNQIRTLGHLKKLNKDDLDFILEYYIQSIGLKSDAYKTTPIISIIISYGIREGKIENKFITNPKNYQIYYNNKLPIAFNPEDYGLLLNKKR